MFLDTLMLPFKLSPFMRFWGGFSKKNIVCFQCVGVTSGLVENPCPSSSFFFSFSLNVGKDTSKYPTNAWHVFESDVIGKQNCE